MNEESWDEYLAAPAGSDLPDLTEHDLPAADADVDSVAVAETDLADASTDIIHASTTDDVDTMYSWSEES